MGNKNEPLKVYEGSEKYAFISYAHANSDKVIPILKNLFSDWYRFWYDGGINVGTQWAEVVALHILYCDTTIFFLSKKFNESQNCDREVHYAVSKRKRMICVALEDVNLRPELDMQLSVSEFIDGRNLSTQEIADAIRKMLGKEFIASSLRDFEDLSKYKKKKNWWPIILTIFITLFLLFSALAYGYLNNWFAKAGVINQTITIDGEELETTVFKDEISRNLLLKSYNAKALYLCGDTMVNNTGFLQYKDDAWFLQNEQIMKGSLKGVDLICSKTTICYLALVNQSITDFSGLSSMNQLVYLDISSNSVTDLSFLKNLSDLQTLKLIDIEATDFSVLSELKTLKYLYIDVENIEQVKKYINLDDVVVIVK